MKKNEIICVYVEKTLAAIAAVLVIVLIICAAANPLNALVAFPMYAIAKSLYREAKADEARISIQAEQEGE